MTNINLKPKFNLLNSNFDGYKLKSDSYSSLLSRKIENGIFKNKSQHVTCYLYTRMESLHNHIFNDPFESYTVYIFNQKGHLLMYAFVDGYIGTPSVVWQENLKSCEEGDIELKFSPSISFPSTNLAITSNGGGTLNILQTGDRSIGSSWVNIKEESNLSPGVVVSSLLVSNPSNKSYLEELHCLLLSVTTPEDMRKNVKYENIKKDLFESKVSALHVIYWFSYGFDGTKWEKTRERHIVGFKTLEYISLDKQGEGVVLLSHDNYSFIYDSVHPVEVPSESSQKNEKVSPKYIFMQDNEEIKLWVNIDPDTKKQDLHIDITVQDLRVKVKQDLVFDKKFLNAIDSYATTWELENGKLEICIMKSVENIRWGSLFEGGDKEGEEILDPALVEDVHNRLAHLTSSQWNPDPDPEKPAFIPGQLEECDDAFEDLILTILDGSSHKPSHSSHLGAVQHLLNSYSEGSVAPSFCLRHDVDGLVWELQEDRSFEHVATYNAFGYVKASKTMAKYTKGSPDYSYVAISDVNSHVYVFCQPEAFGGELRNRKSGKVSTQIARQLIISLKNHDQVMGFHAAPNCLFVLTESELFVYILQVS